MVAKLGMGKPRHLGIIAFLAFASASVSSLAQSVLPPDAQAEVLFQKARAILGNTSIPERERLMQASKIFEEYWKLPENVKTLPAMAIDAEVLFQLGDYKSAKVILTEFLKRSNAATPDRGRMAALYGEVETLASAQEQADKLAVERCNSKHGKEQVVPGCTYIIDAAWRWRKDTAIAAALRARAMARPFGDVARLRDLETAAKIEPPNAEILYLLGIVRPGFIKTKEAVEQSILDVERAMKIKGSRDAGYLTGIAHAIFDKRQLDVNFDKKAYGYIDEAIKQSPRDQTDSTVSRFRLRARIAREIGNHAQSIADYSYALSSKDKLNELSYFLTMMDLAVSQILSGNDSAARTTADRLRIEVGSSEDILVKSSPHFYLPMAWAYQEAGKFEESDKEYTAAMGNSQAPSGGVAEIVANACHMHARWAKHPERGLAYCNDALSRGAARRPIYQPRAILHAKLGNWSAAFADFELALKNYSRNPGAQYGRGLAHVKLGRITQGRADITAALAADPRVVDEFRKIGLVE